MVWKIIGIVLAAVLFLLVLLLFVPIRLCLSAGLDRPFSARVRVLFFSFGTGQAKPKKEKQTPSEKKEKSEKSGRKDIVATVEQTAELIRGTLDPILWLLGKIRIRRLYVRAVCAGSDAAQTAMEYGLVCAALYPLIGFLEANMRVDGKVRRLEIGCDFDAAEPEFETELVLSLTIGHAVGALLYIVWEKIRLLNGKKEEQP